MIYCVSPNLGWPAYKDQAYTDSFKAAFTRKNKCIAGEYVFSGAVSSVLYKNMEALVPVFICMICSSTLCCILAVVSFTPMGSYQQTESRPTLAYIHVYFYIRHVQGDIRAAKCYTLTSHYSANEVRR